MTDQVSIGDFVLTGGELPAMVVIDAVSRMIPGVLGNRDSGETDSFMNGLLEYPQYSRPEVWHEKRVPHERTGQDRPRHLQGVPRLLKGELGRSGRHHRTELSF